MTDAQLSGAHTAPRIHSILVFGVLAIALALRVIQVLNVPSDPLSYQPGPDEDYYLRFGEAVSRGINQDSAEFTFMDPGYGYLLGIVFKMAGGANRSAVFALQAVLDTATAFGLIVIGQLLGRPRAGLYGALVYGITSTAIMFCATLLKEVWVTSFVTWWVAGALALFRANRGFWWLLFGLLCGIGVALRSTLLLFAMPVLFLSSARLFQCSSGSGEVVVPRRIWALRMTLLVCGVLLGVAPGSVRNYHAYGSLSPLPHNGGIVLHQIYNGQNRTATIWIPPFVSYFRPEDIWRGYAQEAEHRAGHALSPSQIDEYWRDQAIHYVVQHPAEVLVAIFNKSLAFVSATEVPNNRSLAEERTFSPELRWLPAPAPWLLGLGLAGLLWFGFEDRRWPIIASPILVSWICMAVFWSEERFRFYAAPILALGCGLLIDQLIRRGWEKRSWEPATFVGIAAVTTLASIYIGARNPPPPVQWDRAVWGYIKMGRIPKARELAESIVKQQPSNGPILEALGYIAGASQQYGEAARNYERAIAARPRSHIAHYNLAEAYLALGRREEAAREARIALNLYPSQRYQDLVSLLTRLH